MKGCASIAAVSHLSGSSCTLQEDLETSASEDEPSANNDDEGTEEDRELKKAATIGTALMVVNSHRALFILYVRIVLFLTLVRG